MLMQSFDKIFKTTELTALGTDIFKNTFQKLFLRHVSWCLDTTIKSGQTDLTWYIILKFQKVCQWMLSFVIGIC